MRRYSYLQLTDIINCILAEASSRVHQHCGAIRMVLFIIVGQVTCPLHSGPLVLLLRDARFDSAHQCSPKYSIVAFSPTSNARLPSEICLM